jgi:hypothetical protein
MSNFFLPTATPRKARSAALLERQTRPSSRRRVNAAQRLRGPLQYHYWLAADASRFRDRRRAVPTAHGSVRISLQTLLNQARKAWECAACRYRPSQAKTAHCPYGNHRRSSTSSIRVDLGIHPDALPFAKIDLDQSNPGGRHRPQPPGIVGEASHSPRPSPPQLRLPSPGGHHARRNTVAACNFGHLRARHQRFLDDQQLVVLRPASPPPDPAPRIARAELRFRGATIWDKKCRILRKE